MATEADLVVRMKQDIRSADGRIANVALAIATGDGSVTIQGQTGPRTVPKLKGVVVTPGDQVLVLNTGGGEVVVGAVTTIGVAE